MATLLSNLSVTVTHRTRPCVLDPGLLLLPCGLDIVKSLDTALELWIAREFWHILNNPHFYQHYPQSIFFETVARQSSQPPFLTESEIIQALQNLSAFRANPGFSHLNLFWIGDMPGECCFPANSDANLLQRWELLAHALDVFVEPAENCSEFVSVWRDTLSLAAALDSAFVLTFLPFAAGNKHSPHICRAMERWGISCREITPLDAIATLERDNFRQLLVQAGLAKFLWAGLHLAVLHLIVPSASTISYDTTLPLNCEFSNLKDTLDHSAPVSNLWNNSQAFWYGI